MNFKEVSRNSFEGFAIIKTIELKQTTKGATYLDMTLADNNGEINAKLWEYRGETFEPFDFVKVRGTFSVYNDVEQFRVERIRNVVDSDEVNIEDYVPSAVASGTVMLDEIYKVVKEFEDTELQELVLYILDNNEKNLLYWPAAKSNHHAVRGGLLMHTLTMLRLAEAACKVYPYVNKDLLYTGVILHDIAKLEELKVSSTGIAGEYTVKGNLLGHLVAGAIFVDRAGKEIGTPEETLMLVEHMLVSHHGKAEWGAAKEPMFIEAELLSQLDVLDARMYELHSATKEADENTFSAPQRPLGGKIVYNHGTDTDKNVNLF